MSNSISKVENISASFIAKKDHLLNDWKFRAMKSFQGNEILNRGVQDTVTGFAPTFVLELVGRNWQSAIETAVGNGLRICANYLSPLLLTPLWNYISHKSSKLPDNINGFSKIRFEDLTAESSTQDLQERLLGLNSEQNKQNIASLSQDNLQSLKTKLLDSKLFARSADLLSVGFLTYLTPWLRNLFTKKVLGITGFTGELNLLSDSEMEESAEKHEKFKYLKFIGGLSPLLLGTYWDTKQLKQSLLSPLNEVKKNQVLSFFRRHLDELDYHEGYASGRGNLLRHNVYGGLSSRLLSSRSKNEFIEKGIIRPVVSLFGNFWGDEITHKVLARKYDEKHGTKIVFSEEGNIKEGKVKTLRELERDLNESAKLGNENEANKYFNSIKGQIKTYWQSAGINSFITACAMGFNIWNTRRRTKKGEY